MTRVIIGRELGRRFAGGQAEVDGRDAAIEGIVEQLNALIRGIARQRLTKVNQIPKTLTISRDGDELTITRDAFGHTANLDGTVVQAKNPWGDPIEYHIELDARRFEEVIAGEGGGRTNTFRRAGEDRITMNVRITSPRLPAPLEYPVTFAKQ